MNVRSGPPAAAVAPVPLGDFTANSRMIGLSLVAIAIGVLSTGVALVLLKLIALATNLFYFHRLSLAHVTPAESTLGPLVVVVPVVGALIIGLMARYGSERIRGHGIPEALEAILVGGSRVHPKVAVLKPLSSAISIGSGGPFGAEGPIIMTGGAFGSLVAQLFTLTSAERKTLLVAGAAAGMSATFASPLAATLLAVELLLFEWKPRSFVPVALASATAAVARRYIIGAGPLFPMAGHPEFAALGAFVCCVLAGIGAGLLSAALTGAVYAAEDAFKRLPLHWMWWPCLGGLVVGLGGLVAPRALGIGFDAIDDILHARLATQVVLALVVVKGIIWATSLGSGTSGGVLAPLLMMGAALGGLEARIFPDGGVGFWPLVGMGAILGGTMRSPLTGIVFVIELTHDLDMLLPLAIAVPVAHAFTVLVLRRSILTEKIARRGLHLTREYAIDELELVFARQAMRTDIALLPAQQRVSEAFATLEHPHDDRSQHLFPVVDPAGELVGTIDFRALRSLAADPTQRDAPLRDVAHSRPLTVASDETLRAAVHRMAEARVTRLLVVDPENPRKVVGKIALHDVLAARARHLEGENRRERLLGWAFVPGTRVLPDSIQD